MAAVDTRDLPAEVEEALMSIFNSPGKNPYDPQTDPEKFYWVRLLSAKQFQTVYAKEGGKQPLISEPEINHSQAPREQCQIEAQLCKDEGNAHFKAQKWEKAGEAYTKAIELCPPDDIGRLAVLHNNRAMVGIKLERWENVQGDARYTLLLNPCDDKAFWRAAKAHLALGNPLEAEQLLNVALGNCGDKPELLKLFHEAQKANTNPEAVEGPTTRPLPSQIPSHLRGLDSVDTPPLNKLILVSRIHWEVLATEPAVRARALRALTLCPVKLHDIGQRAVDTCSFGYVARRLCFLVNDCLTCYNTAGQPEHGLSDLIKPLYSIDKVPSEEILCSLVCIQHVVSATPDPENYTDVITSFMQLLVQLEQKKFFKNPAGPVARMCVDCLQLLKDTLNSLFPKV
eukprot:TRINITY_DN54748_c0_g1_i1.p1 TRINITY_DN54748_c0_g1~~TRINITY_DN54748_c0_g1_i1.p1  ORF type:complete len:399 (-),score=35.18 TRINITY_DN54748_c0_g1_i1:64-1260(-)